MTDPVAVFDGHNDTLLKLEIAARLGGSHDFAGSGRCDIDLPRAREACFAGGLFAMYTPSRVRELDRDFDREDPGNFAPLSRQEALDFTLSLFARLRRIERALPEDFAIATSAVAARAAIAAGRIAAVPHIEGAECIDPRLDALEVLHAAGLRSLGIVWSRPNAFGHGAPMEPQPDLDPGEGLTDAGRALVAGCEALGVLVDCSHLTERGFWDVAECSAQPLVASHSNAHAVCPSARNLTDRQLDAIGERGGLVGLNFHVAFLRPDCRHDRDTGLEVMIAHLDHLLSRLGEDCVALGSDFDGCLLPRAIGDVTGLRRLVDEMRRTGYGEPLIAKICHENWLSLLGRVIG